MVLSCHLRTQTFPWLWPLCGFWLLLCGLPRVKYLHFKILLNLIFENFFLASYRVFSLLLSQVSLDHGAVFCTQNNPALPSLQVTGQGSVIAAKPTVPILLFWLKKWSLCLWSSVFLIYKTVVSWGCGRFKKYCWSGGRLPVKRIENVL